MYLIYGGLNNGDDEDDDEDDDDDEDEDDEEERVFEDWSLLFLLRYNSCWNVLFTEFSFKLAKYSVLFIVDCWGKLVWEKKLNGCCCNELVAMKLDRNGGGGGNTGGGRNGRLNWLILLLL